jgi:hypothetical protein
LTKQKKYDIIDTESEGETMNKKIELSKEVIDFLESCSYPELEEHCGTCPFFGACLEYYTGDDSCNQDES